MAKPTKAPKIETATASKAVETAAISPEASQKAGPPADVTAKKAAKSEQVRVKFLRSHPSFGYFPGDQAEISRAKFDEIQATGPFFKEV